VLSVFAAACTERVIELVEEAKEKPDDPEEVIANLRKMVA
jgi:hypothetical protein